MKKIKLLEEREWCVLRASRIWTRKKVLTFLLMNQLLLLPSSPFVSSTVCSGKISVTSHVFSKDTGLKPSPWWGSFCLLKRLQDDPDFVLYGFMGIRVLCTMCFSTVKWKQYYQWCYWEKVIAIKGLFLTDFFFCSVRKEILRLISLKFHHFQHLWNDDL